LGYYILGIETM